MCKLRIENNSKPSQRKSQKSLRGYSFICHTLYNKYSAVQVYDLTSTDMREISISMVMQWFVKRMQADTDSPGFIIDIIPNMKVRAVVPTCRPTHTDTEAIRFLTSQTTAHDSPSTLQCTKLEIFSFSRS